ncbi:unnamed protein product, partial [Symbiodinium pilosum]
VACAAFRCAATLEAALDAGLRTEAHDEGAIRSAATDFEGQFKKAEQKLREVMSKRWPDVESPSQALSAIQDLEKVASTPTLDGQGSALRRAWLFQLHRLQVPFAYGLASCRVAKEPAAPPERTHSEPSPSSSPAEEDGAMAALMRLQNRKTKDKQEEAKEVEPVTAEATAIEDPVPADEENRKGVDAEALLPWEIFQSERTRWEPLRCRLLGIAAALARTASLPALPALPEELLRVAKNIEVSLSRSITSGDADPVIFWEALRDSVDPILAVLDQLQAQAVLATSSIHDEEEPPRDLRPSRRFVDPPCWAFCSLEVQKRIEEIDVKQREVREVQKQLTEQKKHLTEAEEELHRAEKRGQDLRENLEDQAACEDLQASEKTLRAEVATSAAAQAALLREVDQARTRGDELERASKEEAKRQDRLEKDIEAVRQRPKRDEDGRATAPELAALRVAQKKGAQELYALQVAGCEALRPLPVAAAPTFPQVALEDCAGKYATLRKGLLKECTQARISKLPQALAELEDGSSNLQLLQLKLAEIRAEWYALNSEPVSVMQPRRLLRHPCT